MHFEEEAFPILIVGFAIVSAAYSIQLLLLGAWKNPAARRSFLAQLTWQTVAFVMLLNLLFPYRFGTDPAHSLASIEQTAAICVCGLFWAFSLLCSLHGFRALLPQTVSEN